MVSGSARSRADVLFVINLLQMRMSKEGGNMVAGMLGRRLAVEARSIGVELEGLG